MQPGANATFDFLLRNGYALLFLNVLAEQMGLPIPSAPVLLAAGAMAGLGQMSLPAAWTGAIAAALAGDFVWYTLGKWRGNAILGLFCRISLEPDTCVQKSQTTYGRHGANWLLFAKFVPGLSTIAPPMAGMYKVTPARFILLDGAGAMLWSGAFLLTGIAFRGQLELVLVWLTRLGSGLIAVLAGGLAIYIAFKYLQRRRVYRELRIARIAPRELKRRLDAGESVVLIDLRSEYEQAEGRIPGSVSPIADDLEALIPRVGGAEIVLYCSCPNEISAARAALRLRKHGAKRVRPLEGGFAAWKELGYPVEMPAAAA